MCAAASASPRGRSEAAYEVVLLPAAAEDFRLLPSHALKLQAMEYLAQIEAKPHFAPLLENHRIWGDLSDCRRIYLDETHDHDPRWRIIYRLLPTDAEPTHAEVIIIGPRRDDEVYVRIMERLGRPLGPEHPAGG